MARTISRKHALAGLAAAGVLGIGVAVPAVAFAGDSATPTSSASQDTGEGQGRAARQAAFAEELAKELGVPAEKVTAALEKLRERHQADRPDLGEWRGGTAADRQAALKERLDQAVKDGKLTQEQADAIAEAVESGVFPGPGMWGGHGGWRGGR
jgi:hypothetical protein